MANDNETLADIAAEIGRAVEYMSDDLPYTVSVGTMRKLASRIEAVARRAYNEIDSAVCSIEDAASSEIGAVRRVMERTLGDYYE